MRHILGTFPNSVEFRSESRVNEAVLFTDESFLQPTCRIARVERTNASLQEYGKNRYVEWSGDGHSIFVAVSVN